MKKTGFLVLLFVLVVARSAWAAPASVADPFVTQDEAMYPAPATSTDVAATPADHLELTPSQPVEHTDATCPSPGGACNSLPGCAVDRFTCVTTDTGDNVCNDGSHALNCGQHDAGYTICQCRVVVPGSLCLNQQVSWTCLP